MKQDSRPRRYSWAPGNYLHNCPRCGEDFSGDKRASLCADCAYTLYPTEAPEVPGSPEKVWQIKWVGKLPEGWKGVAPLTDGLTTLTFSEFQEAQRYADHLNSIGSFTEGSYQPVEIKQ